MQADLDDEASLVRAFTGAYGAFCLTNFWEHFSPDKEIEQAGNWLSRAAKTAGVAHVIWSTLEDVRDFVPLDDDRMPTIQGKYKVPHFDAKGEANHLFTRRGRAHDVPQHVLLLGEPHLLRHGPPGGRGRRPGHHLPARRRQARRHRARPTSGAAPSGSSPPGREFIGQTVGIAGGHLSGQEMAASLSKALGREVRYNAVSPDAYRSFGFPAAEELGNMFQFNAEFSAEYCDARDLDVRAPTQPGPAVLRRLVRRQRVEDPHPLGGGAVAPGRAEVAVAPGPGDPRPPALPSRRRPRDADEKRGTVMPDLERKTFDAPDETRPLADKGHVKLVNIGGGTVGRVTFEPGWRWSEHVKPIAGTESCQMAHLGYVLTGRQGVRMDDGTESEFGPGDVIYIPAGHDGWVIGDEPSVVIDFSGMAHYAEPA